MSAASDFTGFARLVIALDRWLDQIVIVGGWAHRLYRFHPRAQTLDVAKVRGAASTLFAETTDDIRAAVTIAVGRSLTPGSLREACQLGLEQMFH